MTKEFNENSTLREVLEVKKAREVLKEIDFPCLECPMSFFEMEKVTLKDIARIYNLDLKKILKKLNERKKN